MSFEQNVGKLATDNYIINSMVKNNGHVELVLTNSLDQKVNAFLRDNADLFLKKYSVNDAIACRGRIRKTRQGNILDIIYLTKQPKIEKKDA